MRNIVNDLPKSDHFEIHSVAAGAYAAIAISGGAAFSNAGIVDLGDRTLIFDTFETPRAAKDLSRAGEQLTGRSASLVIISHAHDDHWLGNQVFAGHTDILSTSATREAMIESANDWRETKTDPSELEEMVRNDEERLRSEADVLRRTSLEHSIARWNHMLEMLPELELKIPNQTFSEELIFYGARRSAILRTRGAGHTPSDCYLVLPDDNVMFMGDLGFFDRQPYMADGDPQKWGAQLEEMNQSDIETFVPGHGPIGGKAELARQREYIAFLQQSVARVIEEGGTVEDAIKLSVPEVFEEWLSGGRALLETNASSIFHRLIGE
jgi:glyoxylase-like metal-dependent hydrolase (beta-lactamase superfamily II)